MTNNTGTKDDGEKIRTDQAPIGALMGTAQVLTFGAKKYAPRNWEKGIEYSRVYGAALRHLFAWFEGQDLDPETGLSHLHHASCCVMFLQSYITRGMTDIDDRPIKINDSSDKSASQKSSDDVNDQNYALYPKSGGGRGFESKKGEQDGRIWRETEGLVETVHGLIRARSNYFEGAYSVSSLEMIFNGRLHYRRFKKEYTARGLVTKAKQFAEYISKGGK